MKRKSSFKRAAALVLSGAMALGAVPLPGLVHEAHAGTGSKVPSVTAYATAEQLTTIRTVDGSTYEGDVTTVGRIKLGNDGNGKTMEWYILGSDPGVDGDNVAIFATYVLLPSSTSSYSYYGNAFNKDASPKTYYPTKQGTYETETGEDTPEPIHTDPCRQLLS